MVCFRCPKKALCGASFCRPKESLCGGRLSFKKKRCWVVVGGCFVGQECNGYLSFLSSIEEFCGCHFCRLNMRYVVVVLVCPKERCVVVVWVVKRSVA